MKNTKRLLAIIALLLSLVMMFTSCEALDQILGQLPGVEDLPGGGTGDGTGDGTGGDEKPNPNPNPNPDPNPDDNPSGDTDTGVVEAPKADTAYKFGMVQGNCGNAVYYLKGGMDGYYMATTTNVTEAIDLYIETTDGGYHLYCYVGSAKTYINFVKSADGQHVNGAYETTATTVYTFDTESKTLIAKVGGEDYWLATRNDKTYTTMGPCKVSYAGFYGQFYGQGGAGAPGNSDGGTGTDQSGNFDLGLIPAPDLTSSSFDGYYVVNNNVPFFTADEKATTTCFEHYGELDSLGRCTEAFACVCSNTTPPSGDKRGDISSVKPTGWNQYKYSTDVVPQGDINNRSHLIAWSLTDEDANKKNLITGTPYMNQITMQIFENRILNCIKEGSACKVLFRVTPIFNGNNLLASGVLMEAYSLHDDGEDVQFCVFVYNVQKGVYFDYKTGKNRLALETDVPYYGCNSGFKGTVTDSGHDGNDNTGVDEIVDTDIPKNSITDGKLTINVDTLGVPSQKYDTGKAMFGQTELAFIQIGNYGNGVQMRDKDGNTSIIWNNTALPSAIARIELVYSSSKNVSYDNADAVVFSFGTSATNLTSTKRLSTVTGTTTYTITPDGEFTYFRMEHDVGYSFYWESITIVLVDGTTINPDNNTGSGDSGNQGGTTGGEQGGNTGSGSTDEEGEYSYVLNKNSKKIHKADTTCSMSDKNRVEWTGSYEELQELLESGYTTCGTCKPSVDK